MFSRFSKCYWYLLILWYLFFSFEQLKNTTAHIAGPHVEIINKSCLHRYSHFSPEPEYTYFGKGKEKYPTLSSQVRKILTTLLGG